MVSNAVLVSQLVMILVAEAMGCSVDKKALAQCAQSYPDLSPINLEDPWQAAKQADVVCAKMGKDEYVSYAKCRNDAGCVSYYDLLSYDYGVWYDHICDKGNNKQCIKTASSKEWNTCESEDHTSIVNDLAKELVYVRKDCQEKVEVYKCVVDAIRDCDSKTGDKVNWGIDYAMVMSCMDHYDFQPN